MTKTDAMLLSAPPVPFCVNEIVWGRRESMKSWSGENTIGTCQIADLVETVRRTGGIMSSVAVLMEVNAHSHVTALGTAICVKSGDAHGLLTARHVVMREDGTPRLEGTTSIGFLRPPRRGARPRVPQTGWTLPGFSAQWIERQNEDARIQAGLPDIAIIRLSNTWLDDTNASPEWIDLNEAAETAIAGTPQALEEMTGNWFLTGCRGEGSHNGQIKVDTLSIVIDRVYTRGGFQYCGMFHGGTGANRQEAQSLGGFSGGPLWLQRIKESGAAKLRDHRGKQLTEDDLAKPALGGVAFYQDTRDRKDADGETRYEAYATRLDKTMFKALSDRLESMTGINPGKAHRLPESDSTNT